MARTFRAKRVTWPPDVSLCQVRLFLSEEAPSQSGYATQDHLQAKASWLVHSTGAGTDDSLPPGFGVPQFSIPKVSPIKWRCPPRMRLDDDWQVARGEESREVETQTQRELKVLEAVYPRPSAIPTGPSVSAEVSGSRSDDSKTVLVPVTPIEEEDDYLDSCDSLHTNQPTSSVPYGFPPNSLPHSNATLSPGELPFVGLQQFLDSTISSDIPSIDIAKPDTMAAAQAAFTAIMKTSEEGSLIDQELLIKILGNPSLIVQLLKGYGPPSNTNSMILPNEAPAPVSQRAPPTPLLASQFEPDVRLSSATSFVPAISVPSNSMSNPTVRTSVSPQPISPPGASTFSVTPAQPVKDMNYYKNLIQQHGEERKESQNQGPLPFGGRQKYNNQRANIEVAQVNARPRNSRGKSSTPCLYFNTPKGCRNGAKCGFLHESTLHKGMNSFVETQSGKRMKFDGEITERS